MDASLVQNMSHSSPAGPKRPSATPTNGIASITAKIPAPPVHKVQPRSLEWVLRFIEDIYNSRFGTFLSEIASPDGTIETFSSFVFNHISKKFGLESLVKQTSRQLLETIKRYRRENKNVELFGLFLSPYYTVTDLMFFLYARSKALLMSQDPATQKLFHFKKVKLGAEPQYIPANKVKSLTKQILAAQPSTLRQCCFKDFKTILQLSTTKASLSTSSIRSYSLRRKARKLSKIDLYEYLIILLVHFKALREAKDDKDRLYYFTILPEDIPSYDRVRLCSVNQFIILREKVYDEEPISLHSSLPAAQDELPWNQINQMKLGHELDREKIHTDDALRDVYSEYSSPSRSPLNVQRQILKRAQNKEKYRTEEQNRFMEYIQHTQQALDVAQYKERQDNGNNTEDDDSNKDDHDDTTHSTDESDRSNRRESSFSQTSSTHQNSESRRSQKSPSPEPLSAEELYLKQQNELLRKKLAELQNAADQSLDTSNDDFDDSHFERSAVFGTRKGDVSMESSFDKETYEATRLASDRSAKENTLTSSPKQTVNQSSSNADLVMESFSRQELSSLLSSSKSFPNHFVTGDMSREIDADPTHLFEDRDSSASPPATHARELSEDIRRARRQITRQLLEEIEEEEETAEGDLEEDDEEEEGEIVYEYEYETVSETDDDDDNQSANEGHEEESGDPHERSSRVYEPRQQSAFNGVAREESQYHHDNGSSVTLEEELKSLREKLDRARDLEEPEDNESRKVSGSNDENWFSQYA